MLIDLQYRAPIEGYLVGKRSLKLVEVLRRMQVEVEEVSRDQLDVVIRYNGSWPPVEGIPVAERTTDIVCRDDCGLYFCVTEEQLRQNAGALMRRGSGDRNLLGHPSRRFLGDPSRSSWFDDQVIWRSNEAPSFRRVVHDYGDEFDDLTRWQARQWFSVDGQLYVPAPEPYIDIVASRIRWTRHPNMDRSRHSYRLDQAEQAVEFLVGREPKPFRTDPFVTVDGSRVIERKSFGIFVYEILRPNLLQYDPGRARTLAALLELRAIALQFEDLFEWLEESENTVELDHLVSPAQPGRLRDIAATLAGEERSGGGR